MKLTCPQCQAPIKLSVEDIQKPKCSITCPSCQQGIELKNNVPVAKGTSG